jgi:hypothetical protein
MRLGSPFRNRDFFPISGVPISALFFILHLMIVSSWRDWRIVVRLIRVAAGTGRLVRVTVRSRRHSIVLRN